MHCMEPILSLFSPLIPRVIENLCSSTTENCFLRENSVIQLVTLLGAVLVSFMKKVTGEEGVDFSGCRIFSKTTASPRSLLG